MTLNKVFFTHSHFMDGRLITHSHPYKKSDNKSSSVPHQHSECQYIQLSNLENLLPLEDVKTTEIPAIIETRINTATSTYFYSRYLSNILYRGPPIVAS